MQTEGWSGVAREEGTSKLHRERRKQRKEERQWNSEYRVRGTETFNKNFEGGLLCGARSTPAFLSFHEAVGDSTLMSSVCVQEVSSSAARGLQGTEQGALGGTGAGWGPRYWKNGNVDALGAGKGFNKHQKPWCSRGEGEEAMIFHISDRGQALSPPVHLRRKCALCQQRTLPCEKGKRREEETQQCVHHCLNSLLAATWQAVIHVEMLF